MEHLIDTDKNVYSDRLLYYLMERLMGTISLSGWTIKEIGWRFFDWSSEIKLKPYPF